MDATALNDLKTTSANKKKLQISYEAFLLDDEINSSHQERIASQMNGFIVTDSRSDNPSVVHSVSSPIDLSPKLHVKRRRQAIKRQFSRLKAKRIAEQHFLQRKSLSHLNSTLNKYPDITMLVQMLGEELEF